MEELQSTDILDREILEDARKKAWRILKSADDTVKGRAAEWEKKTKESLEELHDKFAKRRKIAAAEIISRLPIEKRRIKAQVIDRLLNDAVREWYAGLDRGYIISLLKKQLKLRLDEFSAFSASAGRIRYCGLSRAEAEDVLSGSLLKINYPMDEMKTAEDFSGLLIDNNAVRISISVKKAVDFFLLEKRAELIDALAGAGVLGNEISGTLQNDGEGLC